MAVLVLLSLSSAGAQPRQTFYTPESQLLAEVGGGSAGQDYVWFAGRPAAQFDGTVPSPRWTFSDHLGTPLLQTGLSGAVAWRVEHEPFGSTIIRAGAELRQPLRFPGQESNGGDLAYNVHRSYRSGWGRYSQADPIGLGGGLNLYAYVRDDPTAYVDPLGTISVGVAQASYVPGTLDETVVHCDGSYAHGCTSAKGRVDCDCNCTGGGWQPSVRIQLTSHTVFYATGTPVPEELIINEEQKHIDENLRRLDTIKRWGLALEKQRYQSHFLCSTACAAFKLDAWFQLVTSDFYVHVTEPHPYGQ
ncbi:MAG TPA: RHS repeat-associated core domain-containing protein [Thermoanaerobaculia bacterium]|nr:RHS repeat-associated core domain-containing protein [Thermoanaerobaculia bacterium]